jgi:hypothetical protein
MSNKVNVYLEAADDDSESDIQRRWKKSLSVMEELGKTPI